MAFRFHLLQAFKTQFICSIVLICLLFPRPPYRTRLLDKLSSEPFLHFLDYIKLRHELKASLKSIATRIPRRNILIIRILDHIIIIIIIIIIVLVGDENSQSSPFVIPLTKEFILIWIISRSTFSKPFSWTLISINIYKRYQTPILYQSFLFFFLFIMVIKVCFCEFEISPNSNKRERGTLFLILSWFEGII